MTKHVWSVHFLSQVRLIWTWNNAFVSHLCPAVSQLNSVSVLYDSLPRPFASRRLQSLRNVLKFFAGFCIAMYFFKVLTVKSHNLWLAVAGCWSQRPNAGPPMFKSSYGGCVHHMKVTVHYLGLTFKHLGCFIAPCHLSRPSWLYVYLDFGTVGESQGSVYLLRLCVWYVAYLYTWFHMRAWPLCVVRISAAHFTHGALR